MSGFAAAAAVGFRSKVGSIGFDHEGACGDGFDGFVDSGGVFECRDAGEGDEGAGIENALSEFGRTRKAMEDGF